MAYDRAAREHRPDLPTNYESIEAAEAAVDRAKAECMRQPKAPRRRPAPGFYDVTKHRSNWAARIWYVGGVEAAGAGAGSGFFLLPGLAYMGCIT